MGKRLRPGEMERRQAQLAPLFAYLAEHGIRQAWLARRLTMRRQAAGDDPVFRQRLTNLKAGRHPIPEWFVAEACRELGKPIEEVMGAEWVRRFGNTHPASERLSGGSPQAGLAALRLPASERLSGGSPQAGLAAFHLPAQRAG